MQVPLHLVSEPPQVHAPEMQLPPPQENPHAPQFFASLLVSRHTPEHRLGLVLGQVQLPLTHS